MRILSVTSERSLQGHVLRCSQLVPVMVYIEEIRNELVTFRCVEKNQICGQEKSFIDFSIEFPQLLIPALNDYLKSMRGAVYFSSQGVGVTTREGLRINRIATFLGSISRHGDLEEFNVIRVNERVPNDRPNNIVTLVIDDQALEEIAEELQEAMLLLA
jgi:hypothetical protein